MNYFDLLHSNITRLRKARTWSQADLAKNALVSVNTISDIENYDQGLNMKVKTLCKLALAFEVHPGVLFDDHEAPVPIARAPVMSPSEIASHDKPRRGARRAAALPKLVEPDPINPLSHAIHAFIFSRNISVMEVADAIGVPRFDLITWQNTYVLNDVTLNMMMRYLTERHGFKVVT